MNTGYVDLETAVTESWVSRARARGNSKLDDACVDRICDRIAKGAFKKHACQAEGVSDESLRLLERDNPVIAAAVAEAHAAGVAYLRAEMEGVPKDEWKRPAWWLERYDREAFAPPKQQVESKSELTGKDGAPLAAVTIVATEEEMMRLAARKVGSE